MNILFWILVLIAAVVVYFILSFTFSKIGDIAIIIKNKFKNNKGMFCMKKGLIGSIIAGIIVVGCVIGGISSITKIPAGYAGVIYNMNGGIQGQTLGQGWHLVSPTKKVTKYSVATEQAFLSKDKKEGSEGDDSFQIPSSDGKVVNVDLEFAYHFDIENLSTTFTKFKGQSGKQIEDTFIRAKIKSWAGEVSSKFSVIDIFGEKRSELNKEVYEYTKDKFKEYGIVIDSVNFSRIGVDEQTEKAIQTRINKQQELETAKIEKSKNEIEAEALLIKAKGEADANKEMQQSITPELLKKMEMEARIKHGWITTQAGTAIVDTKDGK